MKVYEDFERQFEFYDRLLSSQKPSAISLHIEKGNNFVDFNWYSGGGWLMAWYYDDGHFEYTLDILGKEEEGTTLLQARIVEMIDVIMGNEEFK